MSSKAKVSTKVSSLNIRSGPGTSYKIVGKLTKGQTITIGNQTKQVSGYTWVDYGSNWVCLKDPRYSYNFLTIQKSDSSKDTSNKKKTTTTQEKSKNYSKDLLTNANKNKSTVRGYSSGKTKGNYVNKGDKRPVSKPTTNKAPSVGSVSGYNKNESTLNYDNSVINSGMLGVDESALEDSYTTVYGESVIDSGLVGVDESLMTAEQKYVYGKSVINSKYKGLDESKLFKKLSVKKNKSIVNATGLRKKLNQSHPSIVQNENGFPISKGKNKITKKYKYNYEINLKRDNLDTDLDYLDMTNNMDLMGAWKTRQYKAKYYNRFKLPMLNDAFLKGYGYVFFTRPDCNVLNNKGTSISNEVKNVPNFRYAWLHDPHLLKQLSLDSDIYGDFMPYLSNESRSFTLKDEYITYDSYGKSMTGHKIVYGKNNVESKTAGEFSIDYVDSRNIDVYRLHKLWTDYISNVYQGVFNPKMKYIRARQLDYACSVYFILVAEDGETIIFWSKYTGVFPVNIPSSAYNWTNGQVLTNPSINITYQYSFKEDFNPLSLIEFNRNAGTGEYKYVPVADVASRYYGTGYTWTGTPYIETVNTSTVTPYTFKLRFRKRRKG